MVVQSILGIPGRTEKDATEYNNQSCGQNKGIQRHPVDIVYFGKEFGCWQPAISVTTVSMFRSARDNEIPCECICHATACGHDRDCSEQKADEREAVEN